MSTRSNRDEKWQRFEQWLRENGPEIFTQLSDEVLADARRYRALRNFVDNTALGYIVAGGVYPEHHEDDEMPPPPPHCTPDAGSDDYQAAYGIALDSLADFLDANRNAGQPVSKRMRSLIGEPALRAMKGRDADA